MLIKNSNEQKIKNDKNGKKNVYHNVKETTSLKGRFDAKHTLDHIYQAKWYGKM